MNYNALARFIVYILAAIAGVVLIVIGGVRGDAALITSGSGLLVTGGLAGANTPMRSGDHGTG